MIIASLASLASRAALLERTIASLEPQVDAICVYPNCVDPHMAIWCLRNELEVYAVARPRAWLHVMPLPTQGMAIFRNRAGAANDEMETRMLKAETWPEIAASSDMVPKAKLGAFVPSANAPPETEGSKLPVEALAFLRHHLPTISGAVVELGSGYGTRDLVAALHPDAQLYSVEHDPKFIGLVQGTTYIHAPIDRDWYDVGALKQSLPPADTVGALIVDGPPGKIGRSRLIDYLHLFGKCPILVDDTHRDAERKLAKKIARERSGHVRHFDCGDRSFATIGWE